jgi:thymidine phosphorylase
MKRLPQAQHSSEVLSSQAGFISSMQCEQIGTACVILGGGRERKEDSVDSSVGIVLHKKVGDRVDAKEPLATIHYNSAAKAERARDLIGASVAIGETPPASKRPLIHRVIGKSGENH